MLCMEFACLCGMNKRHRAQGKIRKNAKRGIDVNSTAFFVAHLREGALQQVKDLEKRLREETGEEIVLVAYKHDITAAGKEDKE